MKIQKAALVAALRRIGAIRPERINLMSDDRMVTLNASEKGHGGVVTQYAIEAMLDPSDVRDAFQISYQHFRSIVESMPDGVLTIAAKDNDSVIVRNAGTRLKAKAVFKPAIDLLSVEGETPRTHLDGGSLRKAIAQTEHAIPKAHTSIALTSLHIEVSEGVAHVVGTDSLRLMVSRFAAKDAGSDANVSVAGAAIPLLSAMADEGDVDIHFVDKSIVVAQGVWLCRVPAIGQSYPSWRRILSRQAELNVAEFSIGSGDFLLSMRRMLIAADSQRTGVGVKMDGDAERLNVSLPTNDSLDSVAMKNSSGVISLAANPRQLAELLSAIGDGDIRVSHQSSKSYGVIIVTPDDQRDVNTSRFVSVITEYRL